MNDFSGASKVIGTKQTLKAVKEGKVQQVILAEDTDEKLKQDIQNACKDYQVMIKYFDTKLGLGKVVGIDRSAAVVAILK
ncbi:ribosomal L7Ae/L30e/S12e/Gadd45 family protein [Eubacteriaceae bacterium ES3]|nr:ribosomal L7Ae/L30e/S12e/Gadd45 family protein [Eubacteriaceae bacterium ES3]